MPHSGRKTFITVTSFPVSLFACLHTHNQPCSWLIDEVGRVKSDSTLRPHVAVQPADFRDCTQGLQFLGWWVYGSDNNPPFGMTVEKYMI